MQIVQTINFSKFLKLIRVTYKKREASSSLRHRASLFITDLFIKTPSHQLVQFLQPRNSQGIFSGMIPNYLVQ